jgi:hypothetical protein
LTKEYASLDWQRSAGRTVGGGTGEGGGESWAADPAERAAYAAAERVLAAKAARAAADGGHPAEDPPTLESGPLATTEDGGHEHGVQCSCGNAPAADSDTGHPMDTDAPTPPLAPQLADTPMAVDARGVPGTVGDGATEAPGTPTPADTATAAVANEARVEFYRAALLNLSDSTDEVSTALTTALLELAAACGQFNALLASATILRKLVGNLRTHPDDAKYQRVKLDNPKIYETIGRYQPAVQFLERAGFTRVDGVLVYKRNDPGLLWLAGGLLDTAIHQLAPPESEHVHQIH